MISKNQEISDLVWGRWREVSPQPSANASPVLCAWRCRFPSQWWCTRRVSCSFFIATISTGLSYSN